MPYNSCIHLLSFSFSISFNAVPLLSSFLLKMVFNYTLDQTGNKTISIITLTVAAENNDAELVCRASNAFFPSDTIEDKRIINVACKLQI